MRWRGSMSLFQVLSVTAGYIRCWPRTALSYFESEADKYKSLFCFFSGALAADVGLINVDTCLPPSTPQWLQTVIAHSPVALAAVRAFPRFMSTPGSRLCLLFS